MLGPLLYSTTTGSIAHCTPPRSLIAVGNHPAVGHTDGRLTDRGHVLKFCVPCVPWDCSSGMIALLFVSKSIFARGKGIEHRAPQETFQNLNFTSIRGRIGPFPGFPLFYFEKLPNSCVQTKQEEGSGVRSGVPALRVASRHTHTACC